jgi:hypothetical protein
MSTPEKQPGRAHSTPTPPPPVLDFRPILDPELSPRACQVLWALCYWAWGSKPYCWPTNRQIADLIGCSPRTVVFALKELKERGYITTHMNRTGQGWYRSIIITGRVPQPKLSIVEPPPPPIPVVTHGQVEEQEQGGGGRAMTCATPPKKVARPVAQDLALKDCIENQKEEKRNLQATTSPKEGGSSPARPARPEGEKSGRDPEANGPEFYRKVDQLAVKDVAYWREVAGQPRNPLRRIALGILERYDRHYEGMRAAEPSGLGDAGGRDVGG